MSSFSGRVGPSSARRFAVFAVFCMVFEAFPGTPPRTGTLFFRNGTKTMQIAVKTPFGSHPPARQNSFNSPFRKRAFRLDKTPTFEKFLGMPCEAPSQNHAFRTRGVVKTDGSFKLPFSKTSVSSRRNAYF